MNNINSNKKELSPKQREELLRTLTARFEKNVNRHNGLEWAKIQGKLEANPEKLWSLNEMERTGGEPDVVGHDKKTGEYVFYDCSAESPKGRTSVCYDREGLESRKEHKPENNAIDKRYMVFLTLRIHQMESGGTLRRKRHLLQRDQDDPVLRPVVIAQLEVPFGEVGIPANTVEQFVNGDHLETGLPARVLLSIPIFGSKTQVL